MAEQTVTKLYNQFIKGLITEASPLNTDYKASTDENNCVLYIKGNRTRRLAIDYEGDAQLVSIGQQSSVTPGINAFVNPNDTNPLGQEYIVDWANNTIYCAQSGGDGTGELYRRNLTTNAIIASQTAVGLWGAGTGYGIDGPFALDGSRNFYLTNGGSVGPYIVSVDGDTLALNWIWGVGGTDYPNCFKNDSRSLTCATVGPTTYIVGDSSFGSPARIQIMNATSQLFAGYAQTITENVSLTTVGYQNSSIASLWTIGKSNAIDTVGISLYHTAIYSGAAAYNISNWPTANPAITTSHIVSFIPTQIDPTWTNMNSTGILFDPSDGNLITYVWTTDAVAIQSYLIKIANTGQIAWKTAMAINIDDEWFKRSKITFRSLVLPDSHGNPFYLVDTVHGGVTNVPVPGVFTNKFSYCDSLQTMVGNINFTQTTGSPALLNGTPASFSNQIASVVGWPALDLSNDLVSLVIEEFKWVGVNQLDKNFLVVQVGGTLFFFSVDSEPFSGNLLPFTIDLTQYTAPFATADEVINTPVDFASGQGFLFVSGANIEPFVVAYDPDANTVSTTQIYIQIRDFIGIDDGLSPDDEPSSLVNLHHYNLKNQGWNTPNTQTNFFGVAAPLYPSVSYFTDAGQIGIYSEPGDAPIIRYFNEVSKYPGNNKQFWVGVTSTGGFDHQVYDAFSAGNTLAPRGHFILDAFNMDYSAFSGITGIDAKVTDVRPPTIAFFGGRVWYAAGTSVYFSQVLQPGLINNCGKCYQSNDPTDQTINQLVASDGGTALIPEMGQAVKLHPIGTGMMVFATNGVWFIGGGSGQFSATDLAITKVSDIGMNSPRSVVAVDSEVYWWSQVGIQGLSQKSGIFGPVQGNVDKLNITEATIKAFYLNSISQLGYTNTKGIYDPATNTITWLFQSPSCPLGYCFDRMLNYNLSTTGFFPYTLSSIQNNGTISTPWICGRFSTVDVEVIPSQIDDRRNTYNCWLTLVPGNTGVTLTFSFLNNNSFMDWETFDTIGHTFSSYLETNYELTKSWSNFEVDPNALVRKTAPWIVTYFKRTETEWVGNDTIGFTPNLPSSCFLTAQWDWSTSRISNKWFGPYQVYKLARVPYVDNTNLTLDTGFLMTQGRFKVRGRGKALQLRFESEQGKDFNLLGWEVDMGVNMKA